MIFNSLHFVVFFIVVTTTYFLIPHRFRWQLVLIASCYFYMVFLPVYILILGFTIVIDYFVGIWLEKTEGKRKKQVLILSIIANVGVLAVFKYYNFLNENWSVILNSFGYTNTIPNLSIILPIGLSFHTFQAMSYTIEVYRKKFPAERNFGIYALYVMYYPQLVAGPIERPQNVLPQLHLKHTFEYTRVTNGLKLMTWGFFKKIVIADRLAPMVDYVYNDPHSFYGLSLIIATVFFAIQIYADFSGYSDIAIGASMVMGIKLMQNFNRPYFAKTVSEFWKRWHISLSTWFRDYVYISMGGNRLGKLRWSFNILVTFLLSGIWHGASWTFVIWGGLNGVLLILESITGRLRNKGNEAKTAFNSLRKLFDILLTFTFICITWIFFRATNVQDAFYILTHLLNSIPESLGHLGTTKLGGDRYIWTLAVAGCMLLFSIEYFQRKQTLLDIISSKPKLVRWTLYIGMTLIILAFGHYETERQFIYFQF